MLLSSSLLFLVGASVVVRRDLVQQALSSAYTLAKSLVLDYQKSQDVERARFAVTVKVWFGTHPTTPNHRVNLAPVIHVRNSQDKTRIASYRGLFSVGGVYHGSVDGLRSQITQLELDFPNGSPSSVAAVCFSFGPDSVMSYQDPVCLPMSILSYCNGQDPDIHPRQSSSTNSTQWLDFCDQADCSRSLRIEDAAEFIYAFQAWEEDDATTAQRLCRSMTVTKPTNVVPPGKFTCYSPFEEEQQGRVQLADIPNSPEFKSRLFTKDFCPIGNFQLAAWADSLTGPDAAPARIPNTGSYKW